MTRITQAYISGGLSFFKKNFLEKYNLEEYHDPNKPALFFGAYDSTSMIDAHNDWKLILPCVPMDYPYITKYDKTLYICSDNYQSPVPVIRKSITPEIKDYSIFKPKPLGDKIYVYTGFKNGWHLNNNDLIREIQKRINFEIITTSHDNLEDYYDIQYLKENYYDKSFLNLNFTDGIGLSTVIEMGLMGMKTIFNNNHTNNIQRLEFPNFIPFKDIDDIIRIILEESKKIGTIQEPINAHNVKGDEWLYLEYWIN
jgi:hypothetical protein